MMFTAHIDLGQIITGILIGIVGFFVKKTIDNFERRIDKHEDILFRMNGDLQAIIGHMGIERRKLTRRVDEV